MIVEVWPDNWTTVQVFDAMGTQWNVGPSGVVGLKYESIPIVRDSFDIPNEDWPEIFHGLRVMEGAVVEMSRKKNG